MSLILFPVSVRAQVIQITEHVWKFLNRAFVFSSPNIEKQHWTLLKFDTFLPPGRLDHSMCIIPWPVMSASEKNSNSTTVNCDAEKGDSTDKGVTQGGDSQEENQTDRLLCFVFGGMNTEGEIYDDCIVTVVD